MLKGEMSGKIEVMEITPKMAHDLLQRGGKNRPVRTTRVSRYAKDMAAGDWLLNGDTLKISEKGELIDGQHRLLACIEASTSFTTIVVYDVNSKSFVTFDDGAGRTLGDALAIEEVPNHVVIAAALGWVWLNDKGALSLSQRPWGHSRGTKRELLGYYNKCDPEQWQRAAKWAWKSRPLIQSVGIAGACHFIFQRASVEKADAFFEQLLYGSIEETDAVSLLRKRLMKDSYTDRSERLKAGAKIALIYKAWRAFVEGRAMKRLRLVEADKENFPSAVGG